MKLKYRTITKQWILHTYVTHEQNKSNK